MATLANLVRDGAHPIDTLARQLRLPERDAARSLAALFAMPYWDSADIQRSAPAFDRLPLARAQQRGFILVGSAHGGFHAIISNPFDVAGVSHLEELAGQPVTCALSTAADIHAYLNQQEALSRAMDAVDHDSEARPAGGRGHLEVLSLAALSDAGNQTVKLVNSTLYDALRFGASDVHFESSSDGLHIKYRIDGVLDAITQIGSTVMAEHVLSRLKVLAELDISERRVPQDGSFRVSAQGRDIDLRVSIMPSVHGEDAVVRILDKRAVLGPTGKLSMDSLGFDLGSLATLRELMEAPYGMVLVTGPTGSGKTTTLYGALSEVHTGRDKIITIEDPVEYQLAGVLQIPVNEKKGLTFARGLRSILRHDPDKIMIGEIRDRETAEIAVQSALTGHLVLTTVHANNVFDVFGRFTHMGLDSYALVSALNGIWAQRLLRLNCPHCSAAYQPDPRELARLGLHEAWPAGQAFMKGTGCGDCRGTGYRGRQAIAEILRLDDEIRELILRKEPVRVIKEAARRKGTRSLTEVALDMVAAGKTTVEEVRRVTVAA
ncbi:GspE/PulE family protein [Rhizobacter sp. Root1221]|uniref:GspE/PulE family protein n=1 Tax=Rhizobacter sp. Root1221 TaxID=1736433 RepID=UPI0006FF8AFB|nr:GspE/PulE family protein [Rhizobacter sp. Root1221]KQV94773.1 general secretion pathway protein GspE [Rhizobacter sp. Root1221]